MIQPRDLPGPTTLQADIIRSAVMPDSISEPNRTFRLVLKAFELRDEQWRASIAQQAAQKADWTEPHPPSRLCMCPSCIPSFDDRFKPQQSQQPEEWWDAAYAAAKAYLNKGDKETRTASFMAGAAWQAQHPDRMTPEMLQQVQEQLKVLKELEAQHFPCGTVTAYEDSTGQHYQFTPSAEWAGARRFDVFEAPQPFDRARETSRRQSAVELLLSIGYVWNDGKWQVQHTEPFGYFRSEPFGWTNCAETDDGAIALYEAPPAQAAQSETCPTCGESEPYSGACGTSASDMRALCKRKAQAAQSETALQKYTRFKVDETEGSPLEKLRAFCAFAMNEQDWFDVEPFFDLVREARSAQGAGEVVAAWAPLKTSADGRGAVRDFFRSTLKRHDFDGYISETLAADFACVLGGYLSATPAQPAPVVPPFDGMQAIAEMILRNDREGVVQWAKGLHLEVDEVGAANISVEPAPVVPKGAVGFGTHALAAELAEAALKDDADPEGHDISAGLFGPNVSEWLRKVAREYLIHTPPAQAQQPDRVTPEMFQQLQEQVKTLKEIGERKIDGCECSAEDACRFAMERDEARALVAELKAQQAAGVPEASALVEALHKIKHKAVSLADAQVIALEALAAATEAAQVTDALKSARMATSQDDGRFRVVLQFTASAWR